MSNTTIPKVTFVTGSAKKLKETTAILGNSVELTNVNLDTPEIQGTPEEIAKNKCESASSQVQKICCWLFYLICQDMMTNSVSFDLKTSLFKTEID